MNSGSNSSEFVSEAQEIIERFSRNVLELERAVKSDAEPDPTVLNAAFRDVHTLKGLASMLGEAPIADLSHELESCLDRLRLGRQVLDAAVVDVIFEAVEAAQRLLARVADPGAPAVETQGVVSKLQALASGEGVDETEDALAWLDNSILGVLTEYEEHRLRENVRLGRIIYRIHASFDLLAIDVGIESLKEKIKAFGEVITYLPSADGSSDDRIELDILVGSKVTMSELAAGVAEDGVTVHELRERARAAPVAAPADEPIPAPGPVVASAPVPSPTPQPGEPVRTIAEVAPEEEEAGDVSLRSLSQTVRVDLRRLDHLMNLVGELGLVQANLTGLLAEVRSKVGRGELFRELQDQVRVMNRKVGSLQQGILEVRMVPLGQVFDKLARVVRKLAREAEKEVRLTITGADTELDKLIVEELSDPLMHMIRNAIDHGLETPDERVEHGKQPSGRVDLRAFQKGNRVVVEVEDDGRGMDWRAIRDTAVERGFLEAETGMDLNPTQAINLIFTPGFSTRKTPGALSGRGVGMDVVKTNISRLSGMIDVVSEPGRGSRFAITLPVTLAIIQALVIETAGQVFCLPLNSVLESIMVNRSDIGTVEGHAVVSLRGRTLPLVALSEIFDLETPSQRRARNDRSGRLYVVVVGLAQHRVGLVVDELLGQRDVVIKPLGRALRLVPGIAGATELGANRTVLLLDVSKIVAEAVGGPEALAEMGEG